jgi:hypothetical protein
MARIELDTLAPEFVLNDHRDREVCMSSYLGIKHVLLVFNRGFV